MPALRCVYCGIAWYFSNSACQPASESGGMTPVTGRHSTIERPDSVSRVAPPTSTSAMTSAATAQSQSRIARWWLSLADAMRAGPYRGRPHPAIATVYAYSHPQADRNRRPPGAGGGLGVAGDGLRADDSCLESIRLSLTGLAHRHSRADAKPAGASRQRA